MDECREPEGWMIGARDYFTTEYRLMGERIEAHDRGNGPLDMSQDYCSGYYDACRHFLKLLPPFLVWPEREDWIDEGYDPPEDD